jgi:hypothetical protein
VVKRSKGLLNRVLFCAIDLIFLGSKGVKSKDHKYYRHKIVLHDKRNLIVFLAC